jgi:hypothetical protein
MLGVLAAAGMAVAPIAASAQDASALSLSRSGAPTLSGVSFFQGGDVEGEVTHLPITAVVLGVVLVILIGVAAISGNDDTLNNPPASP